MTKTTSTANRSHEEIKMLLEIVQRNIKQAIWRYEEFPEKEEIEYGEFDPKELDSINDLAVMWTGGKDSSTVLFCVRELFDGKIPMDVIFVDTGYHFQEAIEFRDKIAKEWDFKDNLVIAKNDEVLDVVKERKIYVDDLPKRSLKRLKDIGWKKNHFKIGENPACCHLLKTSPFLDAVKKGGYKAIIESIRWDEQKERSTSKYSVQGSGWVNHVRVRPSLFLSYEETKQILFGKFGVPKNPMYEKGYTSLGCEPCTSKVEGAGAERSGRDAQKEEMMARLQVLGYHGGEKK